MKELKLTAVVILLVVAISPVWAQWSESEPVEEINVENLREWTPFPSFDGLSLYFAQGRGDSGRHLRLYQATRAEPFGPYTSITEVLRGGDDVYYPWVSPDNLRMYYTIEEGTDYVIRLSERSSVYDSWPTGYRIPVINELGRIPCVTLTADELIMVFSNRDGTGGLGGTDLWMASRIEPNLPFDNAQNLNELNTSYNEGGPSISPDGLTLFFSSDRNGSSQIFKADRTSLEEPFGLAEHLSVLDEAGSSCAHPGISSDGKALYFVRAYAKERTDIWVSYLSVFDVSVDIKSGGCPNPLNLRSRGILPVAVLGTEDFDVSQIDIATVRLAGVAAVRSSLEDVSSPVVSDNDCECGETAPDGFTDLTLKFNTEEIVEALIDIGGELEKGQVWELDLAGQLLDGTPIEGSDCVVLVGNVSKALSARRMDVNVDGIVNLMDFVMMSQFWLESAY